MELLIFVGTVRLLVPLLILRWPLFGIIASLLLDAFDYHILAFFGSRELIYHHWDKLLDTYYLGIAAYMTLFWKDSLAKRLGIALFAYRFVGVLLFFITNNPSFLFVFSNFFEIYFIFYLLYVRFSKRSILFTGTTSIFAVLLPIVLPKIIQEYFMHILETEPVYYFKLDHIFPAIHELNVIVRHAIQLSLLVLLPLFVLVWKIKQDKKSQPRNFKQ
jgi:hypothetical protein